MLGSSPIEVASSVKVIKDLDLCTNMVMIKTIVAKKTDDDSSNSFILNKVVELSSYKVDTSSTETYNTVQNKKN
jgi:hypothetical protein